MIWIVKIGNQSNKSNKNMELQKKKVLDKL